MGDGREVSEGRRGAMREKGLSSQQTHHFKKVKLVLIYRIRRNDFLLGPEDCLQVPGFNKVISCESSSLRSMVLPQESKEIFDSSSC